MSHTNGDTPSHSPCPFCNIADSHKPVSPLLDPEEPSALLPSSNTMAGSATMVPASPPSHLVLSTHRVLAFLDIMPITRGHLLVTTRRHVEKLGAVGIEESMEIGKWLPILSRVIVKTVLGIEDPHGSGEGDWNVVQNNGARAAQVVPHIHFHIIPRPATDKVLDLRNRSWTMFGKGQREDLDDEDGEQLAREMRKALADELKKTERAGGRTTRDVDGGDDVKGQKGGVKL